MPLQSRSIFKVHSAYCTIDELEKLTVAALETRHFGEYCLRVIVSYALAIFGTGFEERLCSLAPRCTSAPEHNVAFPLHIGNQQLHWPRILAQLIHCPWSYHSNDPSSFALYGFPTQFLQYGVQYLRAQTGTLFPPASGIHLNCPSPALAALVEPLVSLVVLDLLCLICTIPHFITRHDCRVIVRANANSLPQAQ